MTQFLESKIRTTQTMTPSEKKTILEQVGQYSNTTQNKALAHYRAFKRRAVRRRPEIKNNAENLIYGYNSTYKLDIFLNIFNKNRKKGVDMYSMDRIGKLNSRSQPELYSISLKFTNPNAVVKRYGTNQTHLLPTFMKISNIKNTWKKDIRKRTSAIHASPVYKEIELYKVCNLLQDDNVIDTVAYYLNDKIVHKNWGIHNNSVYTTLFTENLSVQGFIPFYDFKFPNKFVPEDVIFQLMYTLHCFEIIGLKHMDLHALNFYIKDLKKEEKVKYEILLNKKQRAFYVKRRYRIKIIDFDGGSKTRPRPYVNFKYKMEIHNPGVFTGRTKGYYPPGPKANLLKIIHTLTVYNLGKASMTTNRNLKNMEVKYKQMKLTNTNGDVPFFTRKNNESLFPNTKNSKIYKSLIEQFGINGFNTELFKNYGLLIDTENNFININDGIIIGIDDMLSSMADSGLYQSKFEHTKKLSQRNLLKA